MDRGHDAVQTGENRKESTASAESDEKYSRINQIYLLIISRYRDYIEEKEQISVAELPILVTPKEVAIARKAGEIKATFSDYSYDQNFCDAGARAFEFVSREIEDVQLPLQFWLTPNETMQFMSGDLTDKCVLLCSLLIALGNPSSKVFVAINDGDRRISVYYEFNDSITMFDLERNATKSFKSKDEMVQSFGMNGDSTAYEFNDQMYIDIR